MLNLFKNSIRLLASLFLITGCKVPALVQQPAPRATPAVYDSTRSAADTSSSATIAWRDFFNDPALSTLIDTALKNNQELRMTLQEILIARNDIRVRQGKLLPVVVAGGSAGVEKVGRFTSQGAGDASTEIKPGEEVPEWLPDYRIGAYASWEVDIWKKLRNAKEAAVDRYLATVEGKNFVVTGLVAEIATAYYELLALDNQLEIVRQTIQLQQQALEVVKVQKQATRVTELAVQKFEAEVYSSRSLEYALLQKIRERENEINFLLGRYPQPVKREHRMLFDRMPPAVQAGIPAVLLQNRPDIRKAEWELKAAQLDVQVARKEFYPSLEISAAAGLNAFKPGLLVKSPESLLFSLAGDLVGPLVNRNALKAEYSSANARQLQALVQYEKTVLGAYLEVSTQLNTIGNLDSAYRLKTKEVEALVHSIDIAGDLFKSARADYLEVLMTQRDALESKLELIETRLQQYTAVANIYRALGGGWK